MALASGTGIISGLPTDQIIAQLLALRQRPIQILEQRANTFSRQQEAVIAVNNALLQLRSAASAISTPSSFQGRTAASSNEAAVRASATSGAAAGGYAVEVLQLAQAHRLGSQGFADIDTTPVAAGAGSFSFKVGASGAVQTVSVDATTTLADLRDAINRLGAGVSASIISDGSPTNPQRLVLTATDSGAANRIFITHNDTSLNFATTTVEAATAAEGNTFAGTVTSSGTYTGTASKRYVVEIVEGGARGVATFRVSEDGGVTFGTTTTVTSGTPTAIGDEGVEISFGEGTFAAGDRFAIDAFAPEIQGPQDAVLRIDGVTISRSTNTVSDAIQGVTLTLGQVTSSPALVTVSQDTQTLRGQIVSFVAQYNEVMSQIATQTAFDVETGVRGPLLGDAAVRSVQSRLAGLITSPVPGLSNEVVNTLAGIGIRLDSEGQLQIDNATLDSALATNLAGVQNLFALIGTSTSSKLTFTSSTAATQPGTYAINITQLAEQATLASNQDLTGPLAETETLTFTVGTATHTVTVEAGSTLAQAVDSINDQLQAAGVAITASVDGNRLRLTTEAYGSAAEIRVRSDKDGALSTQLGIGTTDRTDSGVDVAGTIGGAAATGEGQVLTADAGTAAEGLAVTVTATTTGLIGEITYSSGVAHLVTELLDELTDPTSGLLPSREEGLGESIEGINEQIERMQERISAEEQRLRAQFASLETLIAQFQQTSTFLQNQLSQLSLLTAQRSS